MYQNCLKKIDLRSDVADVKEQTLVTLPPPADREVHVLEPPAGSATEPNVPRRNAEHQSLSAPGIVMSGYLPELDDDHRTGRRNSFG